MRQTTAKEVKCPVCGKTQIRKSGTILQAGGRFQRYQCVNPDCPQTGHLFKGEKVESE